ncbi:MAG: hypothetical protein L0G99_14910 [Propionibacteriales bacterium]|nr:hypothetical protein [Propionibacteriales bacterium]
MMPRLPRGERGNFLMGAIAAMMIIMLFVGLALGAAGKHLKASAVTTKIANSGNLVTDAKANALYTFNTGGAGTLASHTGTGKTDHGSWTWKATRQAADRYKVKVTTKAGGQALGTTEFILGGIDASSAKATDTGLSYLLGPGTAFGNVITGRDITVQTGTRGAARLLTGNVAVLSGDGAKLSTTNSTGGPAASTGKATLFAQPQLEPTMTHTKLPIGMNMSDEVVKENLAKCQRTGTWKSSENGNILNANGNTYCYDAFDFDKPTTIMGTGAATLFTKKVDIRANVSSPSGAALNIYTAGDTNFHTDSDGKTALTVKNTFVYAPTGVCRTQPFRSTTASFSFTGSLSCDTVNAAGTFGTATAQDVDGVETNKTRIWFETS